MATLQNIGKLKYRGKDGQWHDLPVVVQDADGSVSTISGKGAPTSATQGKVNQLYRDEDTQKLYICTAVDGGYTWAAVSGGSVDVDATLTKAGYAADAKAAGDAIGRKIDAPQTAAVGEVLTVEEVGEDGKPKKWKTAPGVNITTELTQESTDAQVPSAKAAYDAIQNATDKNAVRFVAQELTDTQKQQARENIGTIPKLFWKPWEEIAKSTVIDDSGSIGYKNITLPVHIKNKDNITYTSNYFVHLRGSQPDDLTYANSFDLYELEDGDLYVKVIGKLFNIFILEKTKIFVGVWNVTLQITRNSETPTEGMVLNSQAEVDFPIRLIGEDVPRTRYAKARTRNSKDLFLDNNGIGYVDPEISVVRSQNELRVELLSSTKTIICNYEDSVTDVFWIKSVENPAGGYLVNQGLGIKNGKIGTVDIVIDRSSASYFSGTFTPLNVVIPQPTTAQPGQIVRVKSVDADGKITETEAVDMPNRLDVTVSMKDGDFVVSHKFAEVKAAYDAGRAVQLIDTDTSRKYSLIAFFPSSIEGVTYADFRFIDGAGDIWKATINSNDEIDFFQEGTFITLHGDIPQDTPKAITYSVVNGIGYADFIPYIEIPSTGDELKERLVISPAYFYVMPNAYAPFVLKNLVNPYTLTRLSYSEPKSGTEDNTYEASYLVTDSLGQQIKATCQVLLTESGLGDLVWNFEVRDSLIVKSSTEGSTKKFKITVDDSGTMSATEITN